MVLQASIVLWLLTFLVLNYLDYKTTMDAEEFNLDDNPNNNIKEKGPVAKNIMKWLGWGTTTAIVKIFAIFIAIGISVLGLLNYADPIVAIGTLAAVSVYYYFFVYKKNLKVLKKSSKL